MAQNNVGNRGHYNGTQKKDNCGALYMSEEQTDTEFILAVVKGTIGIILLTIILLLWNNVGDMYSKLYTWFYDTFPKVQSGTIEFLQVFFFFPLIIMVLAFIYDFLRLLVIYWLPEESEATMR